ncbi:hypothetical protein [Pengzhenrongella sicca]|uniref:Lipoprotein n=1 Tax=Pengzhenrongella sicca TaxID=2819238 RepID=A0A8A4ZEX2_9MICO|nr:hypothetical protein [Pengzhenrongella sicca]QTE29961.1 hypothetical protein J4E96_02740 [Pengzhenrongella sicca]
MKTPVRFVVGTAAFAVVVLAGLAACSSDDPAPDPATSAASSDPDPTATDADPAWTGASLATALFDAPIAAAPLATVTGALASDTTPIPATIEVTQVRASADSTLVTFTLKNVDDSDPTVNPKAFNADQPGTFDIRGITLIDAVAKQRLQPYVGRPVDDLEVGLPLCACSDAPLQMSTEGQLLSAIFPPLDEGTKTVTLELVGFPLLEDLPVSRAGK